MTIRPIGENPDTGEPLMFVEGGQETGSLGVYKETSEKSAVNQRSIADHHERRVI